MIWYAKCDGCVYDLYAGVQSKIKKYICDVYAKVGDYFYWLNM